MILLHTASLVLEDNTVFTGYSSFPKEGAYPGEVVFTTAMSGYQEVCTDPSYFGQIVVFTNPHIGNTGINDHDNESERAWLSGIVVKEPLKQGYHWQKRVNFADFLAHHSVPCLFGVDTCHLTHYLREKGTQRGTIVIGKGTSHPFSSLPIDPIDAVATKHSYTINDTLSSPHICAIDFGMKYSLLKHSAALKARITVLPARTSIQEIIALRPNGILLSNGPGDPEKAASALFTITSLLQTDIPLLGICFGCQLLAIAAGGKTIKLHCGHHSINHPVLERASQKAYITSQNHNFALQESSLPSCVEVTFHSLLDGSVEGIKFKDRPIVGLQFHPEGGPGPSDFQECFSDFFSLVSDHAKRSFT